MQTAAELRPLVSLSLHTSCTISPDAVHFSKSGTPTAKTPVSLAEAGVSAFSNLGLIFVIVNDKTALSFYMFLFLALEIFFYSCTNNIVLRSIVKREYCVCLITR